jgi:hypothetical protein
VNLLVEPFVTPVCSLLPVNTKPSQINFSGCPNYTKDSLNNAKTRHIRRVFSRASTLVLSDPINSCGILPRAKLGIESSRGLFRGVAGRWSTDCRSFYAPRRSRT